MSTHAHGPYRTRKQPPVAQHLLTLTQVADFLGTSLRFVELEVSRGKLRKALLSRRVARISRDELERYITASTVK
jgi:excisionase family DNA binding protein